ncbi:MAG TPA: antibiotic biosynthesis monooxygenase [Phycisphaerales bacterium]|jgi:quinol monooxygenase YgiN|nr:antibiotic biosynthesis monooxygenase [Phycisphaerales bacterium]
MPAVVLHLRVHVSPEKREELLTFLRSARDYYEQPGGIRMRLLQDAEDENALIEVFEYDSVEAYQSDEQRVASDPMMKAVLNKWRTFIEGKPTVEVCLDLTDTDLLGDADDDSQNGAAPESEPPANEG